MPRLIIHIGSQKTGSTSIQTFLTQNQDKLRAAGRSYVKAGRGPAAHNRIAVKHKTDQFPAIMAKLAAEVQSAPDLTHIVSSEMLFTPRLARSLAEQLPEEITRDTRIIAYIRRQDKFLEAMFKQVVKTGRFTGTPEEYMTKRDGALNYSRVLDAYAAEFGRENIVVVPYEPARFPRKNVILDIAPRLGLGEVTPDELPEKFSNITLSREISEMLGIIARSTDVNVAELIRVIIRNSPEGAFHSGDSYSPAECRTIVERYAEDNDYVRATYCPDLDALFDTSDLEGDLDEAGIPAAEKLLRLRQAQLAVFQAIGQSHQAICRPG